MEDMTMENRFLFRGNIDGEWHIGFLDYEEDGTPLINEPYKNGMRNGYEVDAETIGQCTGLKDKNGVLIFEGDVLKNNRNGFESIVVVNYDLGLLGYDFRNHKNQREHYVSSSVEQNYNLEIIGNIHDNPEMLK